MMNHLPTPSPHPSTPNMLTAEEEEKLFSVHKDNSLQEKFIRWEVEELQDKFRLFEDRLILSLEEAFILEICNVLLKSLEDIGKTANQRYHFQAWKRIRSVTRYEYDTRSCTKPDTDRVLMMSELLITYARDTPTNRLPLRGVFSSNAPSEQKNAKEYFLRALTCGGAKNSKRNKRPWTVWRAAWFKVLGQSTGSYKFRSEANPLDPVLPWSDERWQRQWASPEKWMGQTLIPQVEWFWTEFVLKKNCNLTKLAVYGHQKALEALSTLNDWIQDRFDSPAGLGHEDYVYTSSHKEVEARWKLLVKYIQAIRDRLRKAQRQLAKEKGAIRAEKKMLFNVHMTLKHNNNAKAFREYYVDLPVNPPRLPTRLSLLAGIVRSTLEKRIPESLAHHTTSLRLSPSEPEFRKWLTDVQKLDLPKKNWNMDKLKSVLAENGLDVRCGIVANQKGRNGEHMAKTFETLLAKAHEWLLSAAKKVDKCLAEDPAQPARKRKRESEVEGVRLKARQLPHGKAFFAQAIDKNVQTQAQTGQSNTSAYQRDHDKNDRRHGHATSRAMNDNSADWRLFKEEKRPTRPVYTRIVSNLPLTLVEFFRNRDDLTWDTVSKNFEYTESDSESDDDADKDETPDLENAEGSASTQTVQSDDTVGEDASFELGDDDDDDIIVVTDVVQAFRPTLSGKYIAMPEHVKQYRYNESNDESEASDYESDLSDADSDVEDPFHRDENDDEKEMEIESDEMENEDDEEEDEDEDEDEEDEDEDEEEGDDDYDDNV